MKILQKLRVEVGVRHRKTGIIENAREIKKVVVELQNHRTGTGLQATHTMHYQTLWESLYALKPGTSEDRVFD